MLEYQLEYPRVEYPVVSPELSFTVFLFWLFLLESLKFKLRMTQILANIDPV